MDKFSKNRAGGGFGKSRSSKSVVVYFPQASELANAAITRISNPHPNIWEMDWITCSAVVPTQSAPLLSLQAQQ